MASESRPRAVATSVAGAVRNLGGWVRPSGPYRIAPYRSFGTAETGVVIEGRVLASPDPGRAQPGEHGLRSAGRMATRFMTAEVAGVDIDVCFDGSTRRVTTDDDGYFQAHLPVRSLDPVTTGWVSALARVVDVELGAGPWWLVDVLVIGTETDTIVISDIDDTVLTNGTGDAARTVVATMSGTEYTRQTVPGASEALRELCRISDRTGTEVQPDGSSRPLFFVSSSPWNLYDFLIAFFALNQFPTPVLRLRRIGLGPAMFSDSAHRRHKLDSIIELFERIPHARAILIGDSSLQDANAFSRAIDTFPGRVRAAYLLDVGDEERTERSVEVIRSRGSHRVPMILVGELGEIVEHQTSADADRL